MQDGMLKIDVLSHTDGNRKSIATPVSLCFGPGDVPWPLGLRYSYHGNR